MVEYADDGAGEPIDVIGFVQRHRRGFVAVTAITGLLAAGAFFAASALPPVAQPLATLVKGRLVSPSSLTMMSAFPAAALPP